MMGRNLFRVSIGVGLGFIFLAVDVLATPRSSSMLGFPIAYGTLNNCYLSGPGGCGYSYNIAPLVLDFLFWTLVGFAVVLLLEILGITYDFGKSSAPMGETRFTTLVPRIIPEEVWDEDHQLTAIIYGTANDR